VHNEECHNLCCSQNIIMGIISRSMRWAEHVVHVCGDEKSA
jgi:hypothetical protein